MDRSWVTRGMLGASGAAILLLALWVRDPLLPYAPALSRASMRFGAGSDSALVGAARDAALRRLRAALRATRSDLQEIAAHALRAPDDAEKAFQHVVQRRMPPETGVVLFRDGVPFAWTGQLQVDVAPVREGVTVHETPFYTALSVAATSGRRTAVAWSLLGARPPADRITATLVERARITLRGDTVRFGSAHDTAAGPVVLADGATRLLRADVIPPPPGALRFRREASLQARGVIAVGVALAVLLAFAWRDRRLLGLRLFALTVTLAAVAVIPWNRFSNQARAFDPVYYYSEIAGPLSANSAVLFFTSAILLLAVYAVVRSRRVVPRAAAGALAPLILLLAPMVVQRAAQGISHPPWGTTATLWLTWQLPFFVLLFAAAIAAVWLLRIASGRRSAVHLRTATLVGLAASLAATAIVWRTATHGRLQLAARDIQGLETVHGDAGLLLGRFGEQLSRHDSAGTRIDLLKRYATSDVAAADMPIVLGVHDAGGTLLEALQIAPVQFDTAALSQLVRNAVARRQPLVSEILGPTGRQVALASPHPDRHVTSAVLSPRTRLVSADPFAALIGFAPVDQGDPPYALTISHLATAEKATPRRQLVWYRRGSEWHGDRLITTGQGAARAHVEIDLRSIPARTQRTVLIALFDLAVAGVLWALGAVAEGGFLRWARRRGVAWIRSYRGRLTLALFAFFVVPALAFALWSYQRLRSDDRSVRELLVRETLNAAGDSLRQRVAGERVRTAGAPLFLYRSGMLQSATDSLLEVLAPAGRALPPPVQLGIAARGQVSASWQKQLGSVPVLFGYRVTPGAGGAQYVLSAPARGDEFALDRRRRDLAILVLFATTMGAVAALWLSGIAAKRLARDLELSRIEVARAERVLAWGEMARQVAHEIKNPLTPIRLGVQHLRRARSDPRVQFDKVLDENVTRILAEIDRLDEIARVFSRYGTAPADLPPPHRLDVAPIVRDVVALERMGVGDLDWYLTGADEPAEALARADELRDVLLNVFENARLARARNVYVSVRRHLRNVAIEIRDDGEGIPSGALPRVFQPHFSTRTTGSGLGLAMSRRLLESWGGAIEIDSTPGEGARVCITLRAP